MKHLLFTRDLDTRVAELAVKSYAPQGTGLCWKTKFTTGQIAFRRQKWNMMCLEEVSAL